MCGRRERGGIRGKGEWGKGGRGVRGDKLGMPQGKLPEKQATAGAPQAREGEDGVPLQIVGNYKTCHMAILRQDAE